MAENPLVGRWRLVSWVNKNAQGQISYPFGEHVKGYIQYDADGFMFVAMMPAERAHSSSDDPFAGSVEEKAQAAETYLSYCGTYEYKGDTVIHHLELASFPNWTGGDQIRMVQLAANRLKLSKQLGLMQGIEQTAHVTWERVT